MIFYQESLRRLQPLIVPVFSALREGLEESARYHGEAGFDRSDDPHFFSHVARRLTRQNLREANIINDLGTDESRMSSLAIYFQGMAVRIMRARRGELQPDGKKSMLMPDPGPSLRWKQFWCQESAVPGLHTENLILAWGDDQGTLTEPMILARPTGGSGGFSRREVSWRGKLTEAMAHMAVEDLDQLRPDVEYPELGSEGTA